MRLYFDGASRLPSSVTALDWLLSRIRPVDVVEVVLVAYLLYTLYRWMRGTIGVQLFAGVIAIVAAQALVTALDMTILQAVFGAFSEVFVLALVVLFQPELRRLLLLLGQNPFVRRFVTPGTARAETVEIIAEALDELSRASTGALVVVERRSGLRQYAETGTRLDARLERDLLVALFYGENPLHDGAVLVRGTTIEAARCILPVTQRELPPHLGLRHRAAVGISEQSDALAIVVSEETGRISIAEGGTLRLIADGDALRLDLARSLGLTFDSPPSSDDDDDEPPPPTSDVDSDAPTADMLLDGPIAARNAAEPGADHAPTAPTVEDDASEDDAPTNRS